MSQGQERGLGERGDHWLAADLPSLAHPTLESSDHLSRVNRVSLSRERLGCRHGKESRLSANLRLDLERS